MLLVLFILKTVAKYRELLKENKPYEFSQKMLALGHRYYRFGFVGLFYRLECGNKVVTVYFCFWNRKNTTGNHQDAVYLYLESAKELLQANEFNTALSLVQNIFDILKANNSLADETLKSKIFNLRKIAEEILIEKSSEMKN